jgi:hypothetical protein
MKKMKTMKKMRTIQKKMKNKTMRRMCWKKVTKMGQKISRVYKILNKRNSPQVN